MLGCDTKMVQQLLYVVQMSTSQIIPHRLQHGSILDATRLSNGETVILKRFSHEKDPYEKEITVFLSSEPAKSHPRNHTAALYDVLDVPGTDISIIVLPVLKAFNQLEFETVGEVLECFRQIFEVTTQLLRLLAPLTFTNDPKCISGIAIFT